MKRVTIDLNILLDFLNRRQNHQEAASVIDLCVKKKIRGYICVHEFTTLSYFLLKEKRDIQRVKLIINELLDIFSVISATEKILRDALNSPIDDYEDAVIEVSSIKERVDYIITRNISDFKLSRVVATTPTEFLLLFQKQS